MPVVTKLQPQQKNPDRVNLFVDHAFYCSITLDAILSFKLAVGKEISSDELAALYKESEISKLYARSLDSIARRPRSERELQQYLRKIMGSYYISSEESDQVVTTVVEKLKNLKYLDDLAFARWWIEQRTQRSKPYGKTKIFSELRMKGVASNTIEIVWREMALQEPDLINQQLDKLLKKYDVNDRKDKQRLIQNLLRKGFRWEHIQNVLK